MQILFPLVSQKYIDQQELKRKRKSIECEYNRVPQKRGKNSKKNQIHHQYNWPYSRTKDLILANEINCYINNGDFPDILRKDLPASFFADYEFKVKNGELPFGLVEKDVPVIGKGVFLSKSQPPIPANTVLGFYAGEVRVGDPQKDIQSGNNADYIYVLIDRWKRKKDIVIDGLIKGNYTRHINHSLKPNAQFVLYEHNEINAKNSPIYQVAVETLHPIEPGQAVLVDYGKNYWKTKAFVPLAMDPNTYTLNLFNHLIAGPDLAFQTEDVLNELVNWRMNIADWPVEEEMPDEEHFACLSFPPLDLAQKVKLKQLRRVVAERGIAENLAMARIPDKKNEWGIFLKPSEQPIQKGEIIGIYAGIQRLIPLGEPLPKHSYLVTELAGQKLIVDATEFGNFSRFFGNSQKANVECFIRAFSYKADNLDDTKIVYPDQMQVVFFAKDNIAPGEQLLVSGFDTQSSVTLDTYLLQDNGRAALTAEE